MLSLAPGPGDSGTARFVGGLVLAGCVHGALARLGPPRAGRPCFGRLLTGVRVCVCVRVCSASPCCVAAVAFLTGVSSVLLGVCFLPCAVWDVSWPCFPCGVVLGSHYGQFRCASFLCNSHTPSTRAQSDATASCPAALHTGIRPRTSACPGTPAQRRASTATPAAAAPPTRQATPRRNAATSREHSPTDSPLTPPASRKHLTGSSRKGTEHTAATAASGMSDGRAVSTTRLAAPSAAVARRRSRRRAATAVRPGGDGDVTHGQRRRRCSLCRQRCSTAWAAPNSSAPEYTRARQR